MYDKVIIKGDTFSGLSTLDLLAVIGSKWNDDGNLCLDPSNTHMRHKECLVLEMLQERPNHQYRIDWKVPECKIMPKKESHAKVILAPKNPSPARAPEKKKAKPQEPTKQDKRNAPKPKLNSTKKVHPKAKGTSVPRIEYYTKKKLFPEIEYYTKTQSDWNPVIGPNKKASQKTPRSSTTNNTMEKAPAPKDYPEPAIKPNALKSRQRSSTIPKATMEAPRIRL